jgi:hypothetical protein
MRARELRAHFDVVADSIALTRNSARQRLFLPERHDSHVQKTARRRYGARGSNTMIGMSRQPERGRYSGKYGQNWSATTQ